MIHFRLAYQNQLKPILLLSEYWFEKLMVRLDSNNVFLKMVYICAFVYAVLVCYFSFGKVQLSNE